MATVSAAASVGFPPDVLPLPLAGSDEAQAEVVVSGCGPTGLLCGCLLRQAGVDVVLVDPHVLPGQGSKAAVTLPRSMEQMELANVDPRIFEAAQRFEAARVCLGGGSWTAEASGFKHNVTEKTRHFPRALGQNFVERALSERYAELGGRLYRAARFVGYAEHDGGVDVEVERSAYIRPPATLEQLPERLAAVQRTTFRAKFLVGCDGKQSAVRRAIGADYVGEDYGEVFFLADVDIPEEEIVAKGFHKHTFHMLNDATSGSIILWVRLQARRWRTYFCQKGLKREQCRREFIEQQWRALFPEPGPPEPEKVEFVDFAYFEVSCRLASSYRKGRAILAGDAAHCHSPAGGQGMNTGLQDAANLAWKLALVLREQAPERLLDSYEAERRPIAEWVLGGSDAIFRSITTQTSTAFAVARRMALRLIFAVLGPTRVPPAFLLNKMLGLTLTHADSHTCAETGTAPGGSGCLRAGDRMLDLQCREAGVEGAVFTLDLLKSAPHAALRLFLVAETSAQMPEKAEVEACLSELRPLLGRGPPLQPILYTASVSAAGCFGCVAPLDENAAQEVCAELQLEAEVLQGFERFRMLAPADPKAAQEPVCAELCTRLGLRCGGRALLVVRPDGYVAVRHLGDWAVEPVRMALQSISLARL